MNPFGRLKKEEVNPFGRTRREDTPGTEVKAQYDSRINRFLHRVNEPGLGLMQSIGLSNRTEVDLLEKLFAWGHKVWTERNSLQSQLSQAEARCKKLASELATTQKRLNEAEDENRTMHAKHMGELDELRNNHSTVIRREKDVHGREVKKLVGQLLVNQDDNQGWTDDKLKFRYQQLQNLINSLVSPRNREFRVPQDASLPEDLDPTGFLLRATRSKVHFLLQNIIWAILYDRFFLTPFGFGILGHGPGRETLLDMYFSWTKLLGKDSGEGYAGDQALELFNQSKLANNWRSATFQWIHETLTPTSSHSNASGTSIAVLMAENLEQAFTRIMGVLLEVSRLSGIRPRAEHEEEVRQITHQAQDLALQFGLHPARLHLVVPDRGVEVQIGAEVHDCEDGDVDRGAKVLVDLVTLPGLQRIGDGRSDMQSRRTLVPCEIYPAPRP